MSAKPAKLTEATEKKLQREPASQKVSPSRQLATGGQSRVKISQLKLVNWDFNQLGKKPARGPAASQRLLTSSVLAQNSHQL